MPAPTPNYNYAPYFTAVCALPADVKVIYLKALRVAMECVAQNLFSREQIRGVFASHQLTKTEIVRLAKFFPEGVLTFPE